MKNFNVKKLELCIMKKTFIDYLAFHSFWLWVYLMKVTPETSRAH